MKKKNKTVITLFILTLSLALALMRGQVEASSSDDVHKVTPLLGVEMFELCYNNQIDIDPAAPGENDVIRITPSGLWCDGCVPDYQAHQVMGDVIRIDASSYSFGSPCPQIIMPWAFTVEVGPLPPDLYIVEVYITLETLGGMVILHDTTTFVVPTVMQLYLPVVLRVS